jgi:murein DD-endopeptidase MepM/ murein hydrolase activator NlpD
MGRIHRAFIATALGIFLMGNAAAIAIPHVVPGIQPLVPPPSGRELIIPVEGVATRELTDTWGAARSQGRHHEGIDIMARSGTPVRATAPGRIVKLFHSARGGTTLYELDRTGRVIFYYAHLSAYAAGVREGQEVEQGQLLAYVGSTGNATTPHLHFEIQRAAVPGQWWHGTAFNPYQPLKSASLSGAATLAAAQ